MLDTGDIKNLDQPEAPP